MEFPVADEEVHWIAHRKLLDRKRLLEPGEGLVIDARRGFRDNGALDQQASLVHGFDVVAVDRARTRDADLQRIDFLADYARTRALRDLDDALGRQRLDGAAHGLAADGQQRGALPLAPQFIPALQDSRG